MDMRSIGTFIVILALLGQAFVYKTGFPVLMLTLICSFGIGVLHTKTVKRAASKS
ncbi:MULTISPECIES: hypothetical protein [unclassified Bacillus (in: firmicutes)]|uniref:hypothetical protein n=1 Tax=unclassified Bacillus (in: firmicutes) TaxID=185979 RepID=UPI00384C8727